MKVVILVGGFGSRLQPLTDNMPKCLLPIGDSTPLARMLSSFLAHDINDFILITGKFDEQIRAYVANMFPDIRVQFVRKQHYPSNTGYSLMLAAPYLQSGPFIKVDGDLVFEDTILEGLLDAPDTANYVCLDRTTVDDEVIKARVDNTGVVTSLGKSVPTQYALGESIGIEKICSSDRETVLNMLKTHMRDERNWQEYYEFTYNHLIESGRCTFKYIDITGMKWVEIDTLADYESAKARFAEAAVAIS